MDLYFAKRLNRRNMKPTNRATDAVLCVTLPLPLCLPLPLRLPLRLPLPLPLPLPLLPPTPLSHHDGHGAASLLQGVLHLVPAVCVCVCVCLRAVCSLCAKAGLGFVVCQGYPFCKAGLALPFMTARSLISRGALRVPITPTLGPRWSTGSTRLVRPSTFTPSPTWRATGLRPF